MKITNVGWHPARSVFFGISSLVAMVGLASATQSSASVTETLTTTSNYSYGFIPGIPGINTGVGSTEAFQFTGNMPGQATDIQANYTSITAADASFFFLHNIQCKGYCSVGVFTTLTNTVTNTGIDTVNLRLDSNITAGHLGLVQNSMSSSAGAFQFNIFESKGGTDYQLYGAAGQISSTGASITTLDGSVFDGLTSYKDPAQIGLDWNETELSAFLRPLAPGETTIVTYLSFTYLSAYGLCSNVTLCDGVQVAFGDPRNRGGVMSAIAPDASKQLTTEPVGYVLDRGFDMAKLKLSVQAVPEPDSWAMMIVGFGIMGPALRRRRAGRLAIA